jgi:hypothetical protein
MQTDSISTGQTKKTAEYDRVSCRINKRQVLACLLIECVNHTDSRSATVRFDAWPWRQAKAEPDRQGCRVNSEDNRV